MALNVDDTDALTATAVLAAFMVHGSHSADLVARFLRIWLRDLGFRGKPAFTAEFLVQLGWILCIGTWQQSGILPAASEEFPPWSELFDDLVKQFIDEPLCFSRDYMPTGLDQRVTDFWIRHCSWFAPSNLGVEIAVSRPDDEFLLEELANFLWKHRNLSS